MKKLIKRIIGFVFSWRGIMWLNALFGVSYLISFIIYQNPMYALSSLHHLGWSILAFAGREEEKKFYKACLMAAGNAASLDFLLDDLLRYHKLYGPLPEKEEEKDESSDSKHNESGNQNE